MPATKTKIMIATPAYGEVFYTPYVSSILSLTRALQKRGIDFAFNAISYSEIAESRNFLLTHWFDKTDASHLLFIDADMGFPAALVTDMLDLDKPLVGAVYPKRTLDMKKVVELAAGKDGARALAKAQDFVLRPLRGARVSTNRPGFIEVEACGSGVLLVQRRCIETMLEKMPQISDTKAKAASPLARNLDRMIRPFDVVYVNELRLSEDFSFCYRAYRPAPLRRNLCGQARGDLAAGRRPARRQHGGDRAPLGARTIARRFRDQALGRVVGGARGSEKERPRRGPGVARPCPIGRRGHGSLATVGVRRREQLHALPVDGEQRCQMLDVAVGQHLGAAIVENEPAPGLPRRQDRVILAERVVVREHDAQVARRDAGLAQRDVLGDRIILAVAAQRRKGRERRRPQIGNAVLLHVGHVADRVIDGAIDRLEPRAPVTTARHIDDRDEPRGGRGARGGQRAATRHRVEILGDVGRYAAPFLPQRTFRRLEREQAERLVALLRRQNRRGVTQRIVVRA
jgi:hypothetical protein